MPVRGDDRREAEGPDLRVEKGCVGIEELFCEGGNVLECLSGESKVGEEINETIGFALAENKAKEEIQRRICFDVGDRRRV